MASSSSSGRAAYEGRNQTYLNIRECRDNQLGTLAAAEWHLFETTMNLLPTTNETVLEISRKNLNLAYQFQATAIPIFSTMRGRTLQMLANRLFQNSSDVLWFASHNELDEIADPPLQVELVTDVPSPEIHTGPPPSYTDVLNIDRVTEIFSNTHVAE